MRRRPVRASKPSVRPYAFEHLEGRTLMSVVPAPGAPDLVDASDTGLFSTDNLTNLNSRSSSDRLTFTVPNTVAGSTVTLLVDGLAVGTAGGAAGTTTVRTNAFDPIADGVHQFAATETVGGVSQTSPALTVNIDTAAPAVSIPAVTPDPRVNPVDSIQVNFDEPVTGFDLADLRLTRDGAATNLLEGSTAILATYDGGRTYTLTGLGGVTAAPGDYVLTLAAAGSGIVDAAAGNALAAGATEAWHTLQPSSVTLRPAADAYVRDGAYAGQNFGASPELQLKKSGTGSNREMFLKFDLAPVSSAGTATLRLWGRIDSATERPTVSVYGAPSAAWGESTINWNNRPAAAGAALAAQTVATSNLAMYAWDVTAFVAAQKAAGATSVTLVVRSLTTTTPHMIFVSNDGSPSATPQLLVTPAGRPPQALVVSADQVAVPEGAAASFAVALAVQPASDVVVTVARTSGDQDLTAGASTLTFTPANWNVPQSVAVAAAHDVDAVDGEATFTVAAPGVPPKTVAAREVDDEDAVVPLTPQTFYAVDDAYVRDGTYAGQNFGTSGQLVVKKSGTAGNSRESYLKFPVIDYAHVADAKLRLFARSGTAGQSVPVSLHRVTDSGWTEGGVTWNARPSAHLGSMGSMTIAGAAGAWYEFDVTPSLRDATRNGAAFVTFLVRGGVVTEAQAIIESDESATPASRPRLLVTPAAPPAQAIVVHGPGEVVLEGTGGNVSVTLAARPDADVTVTVARTGGDTEIVVHQSALTFTPDNWDYPQSVFVTAPEDADAVNDVTTLVLSAPGLAPVTQTIAELDNDPAPALPDLELRPSADAHVRGGASAGTNFGQSAELIATGSSNAGGAGVIYLRFDLDSFTSYRSAKLRLVGRQDGTQDVNGFDVNITRADGNWTESGVNWDRQPSRPDSYFGSIRVVGPAAKVFELDVTRAVAQEKALGARTITFALVAPDWARTAAVFSSDESGVNGPKLRVGDATLPNLPPPGPATTLRAAADAYVRDGATHASQNFGAATQLQAKRAAAGWNRESLLRFDLATLTSVSSATLRLFGRLDNTSTPSVGFSVFSSADTTWGESAVTWNNRPAAAGAAIASGTVLGTSGQWYELDVTSFLQQQKAAGAASVTLVLKAGVASDATLWFDSDEAANRPELVVTP